MGELDRMQDVIAADRLPASATLVFLVGSESGEVAPDAETSIRETGIHE
jgi:hypothetical protein